MSALKVIFMGTPDFAAVALRGLIDAEYRIVAVYTQPPRPAGRGQDLRKSPVHLLVEQHRLQIRTPVSLKSTEAQAEFAAFGADVAVVAAYGLILPPPILREPRFGCINIHASLLPRWRGAAPIQRAILAGDKESGVTIMQMDAGLDTGPMLLQKRMMLPDTFNAQQVHDALAGLGGGALLLTLRALQTGKVVPVPQPTEGVTYAAKITPADARLDWRKTAVELARMVRAFDPSPGAWLLLPNGDRVKVLKAQSAINFGGEPDLRVLGAPGTILDDRFTIACSAGALQPTWVQRAGKRALETEVFLRGADLIPGTVLA